jgi:ATP-dependent phosphoenolpyruvate carboxykinase
VAGTYHVVVCVRPAVAKLVFVRHVNQPYVRCGWSLVRYGVGKRIRLPYTRKIIDAIHSGELLTANYQKTEVFGLEIPTEIKGVPSEILDPINTVCSSDTHHLVSSVILNYIYNLLRTEH